MGAKTMLATLMYVRPTRQPVLAELDGEFSPLGVTVDDTNPASPNVVWFSTMMIPRVFGSTIILFRALVLPPKFMGFCLYRHNSLGFDYSTRIPGVLVYKAMQGLYHQLH